MFECPPIAPTFIISDDARLAAQLSCCFTTPAAYLPVVDGPRLTRPDHRTEVIRRNNAVARVQARQVLLAGLSDESYAAMQRQFAGVTYTEILRVSHVEEVQRSPSGEIPILRWGRDRIGIGLLRALRERRQIEFADHPSPPGHVPPKWDHLVVCEAGEDLSEVIAANYAYALRAGLHIIPAINAETADRVVEAFYSLDENTNRSRGEVLQALQEEQKRLCGPLPLDGVKSITFITRSLPLGFAFPELPTTHLFSYPDLGLAVANAFAAEQPEARPTGVVAVVDPGTVPAPEIELASNRLARRGMFVRRCNGPYATVRNASDLIELFPYDVLVIATHCGDARGYRWTYDFTDSEGHERQLVVDIALGIARTNDNDRFHVTEFRRFVSLDGVPWNDPTKEQRLYVGSAMNDFDERTRADTLEPTLKEVAERVRWSAALRMYDNNYIATLHSLAGNGTPIIINNACVSWHRLAGDFVFAGTRAYIGTLFPVLGGEAEEITKQLVGTDFGKPLPIALWNAQRQLYHDAYRRPYVIVGAFPQRLHGSKHNVPQRLARRLWNALRWSQRNLQTMGETDSEYQQERVKANVDFYLRELAAVAKSWPNALAPLSGKGQST
jgi:hypothetical protein